jgi:hypothetical protein
MARYTTLTLETYDFPRGTCYVLRAPDGVTAAYRTFSHSALLNWLKRHRYEVA